MFAHLPELWRGAGAGAIGPADICLGAGFTQRRDDATFPFLLMPSVERNGNHQARSRLMIASSLAAARQAHVLLHSEE
jgi:hypothetical protein